jgi:hypothetical protein
MRRSAAINIGITVAARQIALSRHMPHDHRNVRRACLGVPERVPGKWGHVGKEEAGYVYHCRSELQGEARDQHDRVLPVVVIALYSR